MSRPSLKTYYVCPVPYCILTVPDRQQAVKHILLNHTDDMKHMQPIQKSQYLCVRQDCTYRTASSHEMKQHMLAAHSNYTCSRCKEEFVTRRLRGDHMCTTDVYSQYMESGRGEVKQEEGKKTENTSETQINGKRLRRALAKKTTKRGKYTKDYTSTPRENNQSKCRGQDQTDAEVGFLGTKQAYADDHSNKSGPKKTNSVESPSNCSSRNSSRSSHQRKKQVTLERVASSEKQIECADLNKEVKGLKALIESQGLKRLKGLKQTRSERRRTVQRMLRRRLTVPSNTEISNVNLIDFLLKRDIRKPLEVDLVCGSDTLCQNRFTGSAIVPKEKTCSEGTSEKDGKKKSRKSERSSLRSEDIQNGWDGRRKIDKRRKHNLSGKNGLKKRISGVHKGNEKPRECLIGRYERKTAESILHSKAQITSRDCSSSGTNQDNRTDVINKKSVSRNVEHLSQIDQRNATSSIRHQKEKGKFARKNLITGSEDMGFSRQDGKTGSGETDPMVQSKKAKSKSSKKENPLKWSGSEIEKSVQGGSVIEITDAESVLFSSTEMAGTRHKLGIKQTNPETGSSPKKKKLLKKTVSKKAKREDNILTDCQTLLSIGEEKQGTLTKEDRTANKLEDSTQTRLTKSLQNRNVVSSSISQSEMSNRESGDGNNEIVGLTEIVLNEGKQQKYAKPRQNQKQDSAGSISNTAINEIDPSGPVDLKGSPRTLLKTLSQTVSDIRRGYLKKSAGKEVKCDKDVSKPRKTKLKRLKIKSKRAHPTDSAQVEDLVVQTSLLALEEMNSVDNKEREGKAKEHSDGDIKVKHSKKRDSNEGEKIGKSRKLVEDVFLKYKLNASEMKAVGSRRSKGPESFASGSETKESKVKSKEENRPSEHLLVGHHMDIGSSASPLCRDHGRDSIEMPYIVHKNSSTQGKVDALVDVSVSANSERRGKRRRRGPLLSMRKRKRVRSLRKTTATEIKVTCTLMKNSNIVEAPGESFKFETVEAIKDVMIMLTSDEGYSSVQVRPAEGDDPPVPAQPDTSMTPSTPKCNKELHSCDQVLENDGLVEDNDKSTSNISKEKRNLSTGKSVEEDDGGKNARRYRIVRAEQDKKLLKLHVEDSEKEILYLRNPKGREASENTVGKDGSEFENKRVQQKERKQKSGTGNEHKISSTQLERNSQFGTEILEDNQKKKKTRRRKSIFGYRKKVKRLRKPASTKVKQTSAFVQKADDKVQMAKDVQLSVENSENMEAESGKEDCNRNGIVLPMEEADGKEKNHGSRDQIVNPVTKKDMEVDEENGRGMIENMGQSSRRENVTDADRPKEDQHVKLHGNIVVGNDSSKDNSSDCDDAEQSRNSGHGNISSIKRKCDSQSYMDTATAEGKTSESSKGWRRKRKSTLQMRQRTKYNRKAATLQRKTSERKVKYIDTIYEDNTQNPESEDNAQNSAEKSGEMSENAKALEVVWESSTEDTIKELKLTENLHLHKKERKSDPKTESQTSDGPQSTSTGKQSLNIHNGELPQNTHNGELPESTHIDELRQDTHIAELLQDTHIDELPQDTDSGELPQDTHIGELPQDTHIGELPQDIHIGELRQDTHIGELPQSTYSGKLPQDTHIGALPQDTHIGELPQDIHIGELPQSTYSGELPQDTHIGALPQDTHIGALPQDTHIGELPQDTHIGELPQSTYNGELPHDTHIGELPESTDIGELPQDTHIGELPESTDIGELPQSTYNGELRQDTHIAELLQDTHIDELPQDTHIGALPHDTHIGELPQDTHIGELPQDIHIGELPQSTYNGELPESTHIGELPQDTHIGKLPQDTNIGELPQDTDSGELPQDTHIGELPQDTHIGELPQDIHIGELRQDTHIGELPQSTYSGELPQDTHIGALPQDTHIGVLPQDIHIGELRQDTHIGELPQSTYSGELPQDTHIGALPQDTHIGELPQDTHIGELPQSTYNGELPHDTHIGELPESTDIGELPQDTNIGELPQNTHIGELPQGTYSGELPQDTYIGELPQGTYNGELPQDTHSGELPHDTHIGELPQDTNIGELPQDTHIGELPQDSYIGELPQDTHIGEQPQSTHIGELPQNTHIDELPQDTHIGEIPESTHIGELPLNTHIGELPHDQYKENPKDENEKIDNGSRNSLEGYTTYLEVEMFSASGKLFETDGLGCSTSTSMGMRGLSCSEENLQHADDEQLVALHDRCNSETTAEKLSKDAGEKEEETIELSTEKKPKVLSKKSTHDETAQGQIEDPGSGRKETSSDQYRETKTTEISEEYREDELVDVYVDEKNYDLVDEGNVSEDVLSEKRRQQKILSSQYLLRVLEERKKRWDPANMYARDIDQCADRRSKERSSITQGEGHIAKGRIAHDHGYSRSPDFGTAPAGEVVSRPSQLIADNPVPKKYCRGSIVKWEESRPQTREWIVDRISPRCKNANQPNVAHVRNLFKNKCAPSSKDLTKSSHMYRQQNARALALSEKEALPSVSWMFDVVKPKGTQMQKSELSKVQQVSQTLSPGYSGQVTVHWTPHLKPEVEAMLEEGEIQMDLIEEVSGHNLEHSYAMTNRKLHNRDSCENKGNEQGERIMTPDSYQNSRSQECSMKGILLCQNRAYTEDVQLDLVHPEEQPCCTCKYVQTVMCRHPSIEDKSPDKASPERSKSPLSITFPEKDLPVSPDYIEPEVVVPFYLEEEGQHCRAEELEFPFDLTSTLAEPEHFKNKVCNQSMNGAKFCHQERDASFFGSNKLQSNKRTPKSSSREPQGFREMKALMTNASYMPGYDPYKPLCEDLPRARQRERVSMQGTSQPQRTEGYQFSRGHGGWEESLRQQPARRVCFQGLSLKEERPGGRGTNSSSNNRALHRGKEIAKRSRSLSKKYTASVKKELWSTDDILQQRCTEDLSSDQSEVPQFRCNTQRGQDFLNDDGSGYDHYDEYSDDNDSDEDDDESTDESEESDDEELSLTPVSISEQCQKVGALVWGKLQHERWWPGLIVPGELHGRRPAKAGSHWVFWLGEHTVSELTADNVRSFVQYYNILLGKKPGKFFQRGVNEALMILEKRCDLDTERDLGKLLEEWASDGFQLPEEWVGDHARGLETPDPACPLPDFVVSRLREIMVSSDQDNTGQWHHSSARGHHTRRRPYVLLKNSAIEQVNKGSRKLDDICLACDDADKQSVCDHPLFVGGLCQECKDELMGTLLAYGDDGTCMFCTICSSGGTLFVCDNKNCYRTYCPDCISTYLGDNAIKKLRRVDPWLCFLCTPHNTETHGSLYPKPDWRYNILKMFDTRSIVKEPDLKLPSQEDRRKIRVLSLYDGIGTGKLVLDELGFDVEIYYASETDREAIAVTNKNHQDSVLQLGSVQDLTYSKVQELGPIDLLIGGSPCKEFMMSYLDGNVDIFSDDESKLFFHFTRIFYLLTRAALMNGRQFFWIYENVACMKPKLRKLVNWSLSAEPALWDALFFSPMHRPRLFWGNIPGMQSSPYSFSTEPPVTLGSMLNQNLHRVAKYDALRCMRLEDRYPVPGCNEDIFPVTMSGEDDNISVEELERIFGFPTGYTDVTDLSRASRYRLLNEAWSVPVIKEILRPLTLYFKTTDTRGN